MKFTSITNLLNSYYNGALNIAYWYFAGKTLISIFKNASDNDWRGSLQALSTGAISYGSCHLVITLFDEIKKSFGK